MFVDNVPAMGNNISDITLRMWVSQDTPNDKEAHEARDDKNRKDQLCKTSAHYKN